MSVRMERSTRENKRPYPDKGREQNHIREFIDDEIFFFEEETDFLKELKDGKDDFQRPRSLQQHQVQR